MNHVDFLTRSSWNIIFMTSLSYLEFPWGIRAMRTNATRASKGFNTVEFYVLLVNLRLSRGSYSLFDYGQTVHLYTVLHLVSFHGVW